MMHLPLSRMSAGVESSIGLGGLLAFVADLVDAQLARQGAQFAVGAAGAGLAVAVVLGEEQLDDGPAAPCGRGGELVLTTFMPSAAGATHEATSVLRALDLDDAHAAGADRLHVFQVAQRRHLGAA